MIRPDVKRLFRLALRRRDVVDENVDEEIALHVDLRAKQLEAQGLAPGDARREAERRFGGTAAARRSLRTAAQRRENRFRIGEWLDGLWHDIRLTARQLRRARGFTAIAVLTLALGIGADAAIFTVFHRLLLDPLPFPHGNRIVELVETFAGGHILTAPDTVLLDAWEARAHTLHDFGAVDVRAYHVAESASADSLMAAKVTPGFMRLLQVRPVLGRDFLPADASPGAPAVAVIGYGFWQQVFGGRRNVLGASIHANGRTYTIVGVAPRGMAQPMPGSTPPSLWLPLPRDSMLGRPNAFARLSDGATAADASREMRAIMATLPNAAIYAHSGGRAMRAQDLLGSRTSDTVKILFGAVGVLLLIACANVANLLLVRAWSRRRELAVRIALGAGRARLVRQMLAESVGVAVMGGALALVVARETLALIVGMRPPSLTELGAVTMDPGVLAWTAMITLAAGLVLGLVPALLTAGRPVADELRSDSRTISGGSAARRVRAGLVTGEVALSLLLLVGAGLLLRSFVALQRTPLGFEPSGLVGAEMIVTPTDTLDRVGANEREIARRLPGVGGITEAVTGSFPGDLMVAGGEFQTDDSAGPRTTDVHGTGLKAASPGYFRLLRTPLLAGRSFTERDAGVENAVVINHALAQRLWPNGGAVGKRFRFGQSAPWYTVIGVVADVRKPGVSGDLWDLQVYRMGGASAAMGEILVRTTGSVADAETALRRAVAHVDPSLKVRGFEVGDSYVHRALAPQRFSMALLGSFASVALLLAAVGLYGVVSYAVSRRTREIGVRVALGAQPGSVTRLVLGEGLRLTAVGVIVGLAGAAFATRAMQSMLYGVTPLDPWTFAGVALLLVAITVLAAYVPMRRALRIDPAQALRAE